MGRLWVGVCLWRATRESNQGIYYKQRKIDHRTFLTFKTCLCLDSWDIPLQWMTLPDQGSTQLERAVNHPQTFGHTHLQNCFKLFVNNGPDSFLDTEWLLASTGNVLPCSKAELRGWIRGARCCCGAGGFEDDTCLRPCTSSEQSMNWWAVGIMPKRHWCKCKFKALMDQVQI